MIVGSVWRLIEKGGQQLSSFIVFAVIARLIGPEEYGLVALCYIFLSLAFGTVSGIVDPIISLQIKDDVRLSSIFWSIVGIGGLISLLTYFLSTPFSILINEPKIEQLLKVFAILPFLISLSSVPSALVTASMNFRVYTIRTFIATILGGGVGIYMALNGYGGYALIGQQITLYITTNAVVWVGSGWHPKLKYNIDNIVECFKLGVNQTGSAYISLIESHIPKILLGIVAGPYVVGQWAFIVRLKGTIQDLLMQPIISVIYPAFSKIQHDIEEQKNILKHIVKIFGFLMFPVTAFSIIMAPQYIPLFFGEIWKNTVPLLNFYFILSAITAFTTIICDIMRAHKQIIAYFRVQSIIIAVWIASAAVLVNFGLRPLLLGEVFIGFVGLLIYARLLATKTGIDLRIYLKLLWPSLFASVWAALAAWLLSQTDLAGGNVYFSLTMALGGGISVYLSVYGVLERNKLKKLIAFLKSKHRSKINT